MANYASNDSKYINEAHQYYTGIQLLDTVTRDRIQMARTHGLDPLVAPVTRLPIRLYRALTKAHCRSQ